MFLKKLYFLRKLTKQQWMSREEIEKIRDKKLCSIIRYAYNNNPFYRKLYKDYKKEVYSFKGFRDLQKLPVVEKEDVQKYSNKIFSKDLDYFKLKKSWGTSVANYTVRRTSGSSGQPLFVVFDNNAWDYSEAAYARSLLATGHKSSDVLVVSYPYPSPRRKWFNYLGFMRKTYLRTDLKTCEQLAILKNEKSEFSLYSFPSVLLMLIDKAKRENMNLNVKRVISTGECLMPRVRNEIEKSFGCKVYDHYGSMEFNRIAWQCDMLEGFHMDTDSLAVEFVKERAHVSEGEKGEVLITSLYNYTFPLIRYRQGDFGKFSMHKCSCGRGLPLMEEIAGREADFIITSDNKLIPPVVTDTTLGSIKGVLQFKLIQDEDKSLALYLVKKEGSDNDIKFEAVQKLLKIDPHAKVKIVFTKHIERNDGGKFRSIISKYPKTF